MVSSLEALSSSAAASASASTTAASAASTSRKKRASSADNSSADEDEAWLPSSSYDEEEEAGAHDKKPASSTSKGKREDKTAEGKSSSSMETEYTRARKGQQQWTELTAVCHMFCDEVHKYMNPIAEAASASSSAGPAAASASLSSSSSRKRKDPPHLSMGEKRFLNLLVSRVKQRVDEQSKVVLENRRLVHEAKQAKCRVRDRRNDIMITRLLTRKTEGEVAALERQLRRMKRDGEKRQKASKFLSAIEFLAGKKAAATTKVSEQEKDSVAKS